MDFRAALAPRPVDIQLGEYEYTIPPRPAAEWIEALAGRDYWLVVPGLLGDEDRDDVEVEYMLGHVEHEDLRDAARSALQEAGGRHWWEVERLVGGAIRRDLWSLAFGSLILTGFDFEQRSLGAFVAALFALTMDRIGDETKRQQFENELAMPPEGVDLDELIDDDEEEAAFAADLAEFDAATS